MSRQDRAWLSDRKVIRPTARMEGMWLQSDSGSEFRNQLLRPEHEVGEDREIEQGREGEINGEKEIDRKRGERWRVERRVPQESHSAVSPGRGTQMGSAEGSSLPSSLPLSFPLLPTALFLSSLLYSPL